MLISTSEALTRLSSPRNLKNKLEIFGLPKEEPYVSPFLPASPDNTETDNKVPTIDDVMKDVDSKIKLGLAHDKAVDILDTALDTLQNKLDSIKPEKLPGVITSVSKMVEGIRKERLEATKTGQRDVHLHFYTPTPKQITDYQTIEVG